MKTNSNPAHFLPSFLASLTSLRIQGWYRTPLAPDSSATNPVLHMTAHGTQAHYPRGIKKFPGGPPRLTDADAIHLAWAQGNILITRMAAHSDAPSLGVPLRHLVSLGIQPIPSRDAGDLPSPQTLKPV